MGKKACALLLALLILCAQGGALAEVELDDLPHLGDETGMEAETGAAFEGRRKLNQVFPDAALRQLVAAALRVKPSAEVTADMLASIYELEAGGKDKIRRLDGLETLVNLESLSLTGQQISDVSPLSGLHSLELLDLRSNLISDVSPLSGLRNLLALGLRDNRIADIAPLSGLTRLQALTLESNPIASLRALANLTTLSAMSFGSAELKDIAALSRLTNLEYVEFSAHNLDSIEPFRYLENLEELLFTADGITDISPLGELTALTALDIGGIQIEDISPLAKLTGLRALSINTAAVYDLTPLIKLTSLRELDLTGNRIVTVAPLSALTNLRELYLSDNRISDVAPLSELRLNALVLTNNRIADLSPLLGESGRPAARLVSALGQSIVEEAVQPSGGKVTVPVRVSAGAGAGTRLIDPAGGSLAGDSITWSAKSGRVLRYEFSASDEEYYEFGGTVFIPVGSAKAAGYYEIVFDTNDGSPYQTGLRAVAGERVKKPADPARSGYRFAGWNTKPDGSGKTWNFGRESMPAERIMLYAMWK